MPSRSSVILVVCLVVLAACGGRGGFAGEIVHPAELPVRAFAPIALAHANDADSIAVASGVRDALIRGGTETLVVGALEMAPSSARVRIDLVTRFRARSEVRWSTRPENVCGPYGCYVRQVSYPYDVSVLMGETSLRIVDLASGTELADRTAVRELPGGDGEFRRAQLRNELVAQIVAWIDPRIERVHASFLRVRLDPVARAREHARDSRWDEAASVLQAFVDSPSFAGTSPSVRADVLHDLALSIRFGAAVRTEPVRALERALAIAEESVRLDARATHVRLRDELRGQLDEARILERQNRPIEASPSPIPVPPGYDR